MRVKEDQARKLLESMRFTDALTISRSQVIDRLNRLPFLLDESAEPQGEYLILLRGICNSLEEGEEVGLEKEIPEETPESGQDETEIHERKPRGNNPGIIAYIEYLLGRASCRKPISKADILEACKRKFPDRDVSAMRSTISCQVPSKLTRDKGLVIARTSKGYWMVKDRT